MSDDSERIRIGDHVTIYPRGKRRIWCADYWRDGKHCRQSLKTPNKKIATQRAMALEVVLANGTFQPPPPNITVAQASADYLAHLTTEGRAPKTLAKYRGILTTFTDFLKQHGATALQQFTATHFDRFRAMRKPDHYVKTMYTEGVIVKQFMKWCTSRKLIRENPIVEFKLVMPPLVPKEGPGLGEINVVLSAADGSLLTILATLAFTGMRSGELQRLRKEDVDLAGNWIHVISRAGAETKTKRSRKVPIHPRLREFLEGHRRPPGPWFFAAEASSKFPGGGNCINTKKLNDKFQALLKTVGLPTGREKGFTIHSLRHSFETIAVNAVIPQRVIDTWLGHHSDKSMAAVYYKLKDEDSQKFMTQVPFGTPASAACAPVKEDAE